MFELNIKVKRFLNNITKIIYFFRIYPQGLTFYHMFGFGQGGQENRKNFLRLEGLDALVCV